MTAAHDPFAAVLGLNRGAARVEEPNPVPSAQARVREFMKAAKRLPPVPATLSQHDRSQATRNRRITELRSMGAATFALMLRPGWLQFDPSTHGDPVRVLYVWTWPSIDLDDFLGLLANFTAELDDWTWLRPDAGSPYELGNR